MRDPVVESVINKFKLRSEVGYNKYGTSLNRTDLSGNDWLNHLQEELMDAVNYIEAYFHNVNNVKDDIDFKGDHIRTYSGRMIDVFNLSKDDIDIEDIAIGLANTARWAGQTLAPYSVAQHSVMCAIYAPDELKLQALLHDASEAYIGDIPRPIKKRLPEYKTLENDMMKIISEVYGFDYPLHEDVKYIDNQMLKTEYDVFFNGIGNLNVWDSTKAIEEFLSMFVTITNERREKS